MIDKEDLYILTLVKNPDSKEKGFNLLLKKYQKKIYFHIFRMISNHDDTHDLVQEVSIKIWNNIEKFKGESQLYSWIYRITTNATFTFINQNKKNQFVNFQTEDEDESFVEKIGSHETQFNENQIETYFIKALETLPAKQKLVFNMRYYDEMSYEQINEILGTSVGALKASYHHAVKKIEYFILNQI